jgi:hypothetical protein
MVVRKQKHLHQTGSFRLLPPLVLEMYRHPPTLTTESNGAMRVADALLSDELAD